MANWFTRLFSRRPDPDAARIRRAEADLREAELRTRRKLIESALYSFDNYVDPREVLYDDPTFMPGMIGDSLPANLDNRKKGEYLPVYITENGLKVARDQSRHLLANNEFAINAVENRVSYVVGTGFQYKVTLKDSPQTRQDESQDIEPDPLCVAAQAVLDEFRARTDWGELEQELVRRGDRDGEWFLRWFDQPSGIPAVRVVEPEHVKSPQQSTPGLEFGVQTDPEDVETVKAYWVVVRPEASPTPEPIEAGEILHVKLNGDRNSKRGLPTLYPVRKNLERAEKLLRNMSTVAQVQATFALIRKHKGYSAAAVETFRNDQADVQYTAPVTGRDTRVKQFLPGSIIDAPEGTEYEFPSAGVAAHEYVEILQAELRAVAARLCMPEYMLTADASNANYASTLVAEAPAVKHFERLQDFYARKFGRGPYRPGPHCGAMWRVLRAAVAAGRLPAEVLARCELQVEGPSLTVRDRGQETDRWEKLSDAGLLSPRTWATHEGLDYDQEQRRGAKARQQAGADGSDGLPLNARLATGDRPRPGLGMDFGESEDAAGHEHGEKGRFVGKGKGKAKKADDGPGLFGGGGGDDDKPTRGEHAKAAHAARQEFERKKAEFEKARAAMLAHHEKARDARREAFEAVRAKAVEADDNAGELAASMQTVHRQLAWAGGEEWSGPFDELDDLVSYYDHSSDTRTRYDELKQIEAKARECLAAQHPIGHGENDITPEQDADNKRHLQFVINTAGHAREALKEYARHRKELRAIKAGEPLSEAVLALVEACVPNRSGNRRHDDRTGRPCKIGDGSPGAGTDHDRMTVDKARQHAERAKSNPTPETVAELADTLSRLTVAELREFKKSHGIRAGGNKSELARKLAHEATRRLTLKEKLKREARVEGLKWEEVAWYGTRTRQEYNRHADLIGKVLAEARKSFEHYSGGGKLTRRMAGFKDGGDPSKIPHLDVIAETLSRRYPEVLGSGGYNPETGETEVGEDAARKLFDLLLAGTPQRMGYEAGYRAGFDVAREQAEVRSRPQPALFPAGDDDNEVPF